METLLREEKRTARLNPFFFPSDTDFRFVLLAVAVLSSTLFTYNIIWNNLGRNATWYTETTIDCLSRPGASPEAVVRGAREGREVESLGTCMAPVNRSIVLLGVQGAMLVFAVAGLGYWLLPAWRLRRGRLEPIDPADLGDLTEYLHGLSGEAGLRRPPVFVWNPLALGGTPLAFGNLGNRYVFLPAGLVQEFYVDRPLFRAVVLHELAHLRNADVDKTFLSVFLWRAFLGAAILPLLLAAGSELTLSELGGMGWRVLALAALVLFVRNAVLRAREVYADVRVSAWEPDTEPLERALAAEPPTESGAGWRRLLATHPAAQTRRAALRDTRGMFQMGMADAAATGAVVALSLPHVYRAFHLVDLSGLAVTSVFLTAVVLAPLVAGVLGMGVWRATLAARVLGEANPRLEPIAHGFAAGMGAGSVVSLSSWARMGERPGLAILGIVLWSVLLGLSLRPLLRWIADGSRHWLEVVARSKAPRSVALAGLTLTTVVVTFWLAFVIFAHPLQGLPLTLILPDLLGTLAAPFAAVGVLIFILPAPLVLLAGAGLWLYPILPLALHSRVAIAPRWDWAFLGDGAQAVPAMAVRSSLPEALRSAVRAAALYAVLALAIRLWYRLGVDLPSDRKSLMVVALLAVLAAFLQAFVARRTARAATVLRGPSGLFAAFTAGLLMTVVFHAINLAFQGGLEASFVWMTLRIFIGLGVVLSFFALARLPAPIHGGH